MATYLADPATAGLNTIEVLDKDNGRIETRTTTVSHDVGWLTGDRRHPGEHRFPALRSLVKTVTRIERGGKTTQETRYFISSALLTPERATEAIRSHWGIESLHWMLDVVFKEDQSRLRRGYGAQNMASCVASPSIWCGPKKENDPSKQPERRPDGTPTPSRPSSAHTRVNLDSMPWASSSSS